MSWSALTHDLKGDTLPAKLEQRWSWTGPFSAVPQAQRQGVAFVTEGVIYTELVSKVR